MRSRKTSSSVRLRNGAIKNSGLKAIEKSRPLYCTGSDSFASPTSGVLAVMSMLFLAKLSLIEFDFSLAKSDTRRREFKKGSRPREIRSLAPSGTHGLQLGELTPSRYALMSEF